MKRIFFLFLLILGHVVVAQEAALDKEIEEIDSLIKYNRFDIAEKKANSLYRLLNEKPDNKKHLKQRLKVRFQQGLIKDDQFDHRGALPIFLQVLKGADENKLYKLSCEVRIKIALNQENARNYSVSFEHLKEARKLTFKHHFKDLYSSIYLGYSSIYRFVSDTTIDLRANQRELLLQNGLVVSRDSAIFYARKGIDYAIRYKNEADINTGLYTLGILSLDLPEKIQYFIQSLAYMKKVNDCEELAVMYTNVADCYKNLKEYDKALMYSDSSLLYYDKIKLYYKYTIPESRYRIFEELGNVDSAYYYFKMYSYDAINYLEKEDQTKTKQLEEQYQNDKKEAIIKSKNQQMILIGSLLAVIGIASVLLFLQNRRINSRNKIINKQLAELSKTLEQKQMLLSELQHRVKNNLQHVISILEIQKESVDFNNIDELIRGNQNRIHSMALLHKKLNVSESVNEVDLKRYVTELSELVKESYDNHKKKISLNIKCDVDTISIEKALPLGLIITELVSNSMKHAFRKQNIGIITVEITKNEAGNTIYYADNGIGFDFNKVNEKGLGQEIIKGLIDQLDGTVETDSKRGFELTVCFK